MNKKEEEKKFASEDAYVKTPQMAVNLLNYDQSNGSESVSGSDSESEVASISNHDQIEEDGEVERQLVIHDEYANEQQQENESGSRLGTELSACSFAESDLYEADPYIANYSTIEE